MAFVNVKVPSGTPSAFPTQEQQVPAQAQQQQVSAIAAAVQDAVAEIEELDEAERRSIKANYYRQIMHMELFDNDQDPEAYEVEKEIQAFARERMRVFLGMDPDTRTPAEKATPVQIKLPFSEQQIDVLSSWADGLIQRPQLLAATSAAPRGRQVEQTTPVVAQTSAQTQAPVFTTPVSAPRVQPADPNKRGRGRPPGTGKNQRAQPSVPGIQAQQQNAPTAPAPIADRKLPVGAEIDPETGRPYLMVETIIDGKTAFRKVDISDQTTPVGVQPKAWPTGHSPLENVEAVTQMRIAKGMENGNGSASMDGQLSNIIKQFQ